MLIGILPIEILRQNMLKFELVTTHESLLKCFDILGRVIQSGSRCSTSLRSSIRLVKKEVMGLIPDECWFFSLHIGLVVCPFNNGI